MDISVHTDEGHKGHATSLISHQIQGLQQKGLESKFKSEREDPSHITSKTTFILLKYKTGRQIKNERCMLLCPQGTQAFKAERNDKHLGQQLGQEIAYDGELGHYPLGS